MSDLFDLPFEDEEPEVDAAPDLTFDKGSGHPEPSRGMKVGPTYEKTAAPDEIIAAQTDKVPPPLAKATVPAAADRRRVYSVTEVTVRVRDLLESEFFEVWVEGELSNCRLWNTGHLYFTLKDSASQIKGVIFKSALRYLKFKPADGQRVIARGRLSVYEPKGEYQLVCEHLEPHGLGALQLAFEQLKKRLQAEGLFDADRKRPLPALPRKIGVVTSLDGAALRDILKVLSRRYANAHIVIRPARVQGEDAAPDIATALNAITRVPGVDVVIVGRGGGSIEDLWAFNEERVARAIARSTIPIISAVGHETDVTIADFVADVRAPTPSAAAEMVVSAHDDFCARIDRLHDRLLAGARRQVQQLSRRAHMVSGRPALAGFPGRIAMRGRHAAELSHALARAARADIGSRARRLQQIRRQLDTLDLGRRMASIRTRLVGADGRLAAAVNRHRHRADRQLRDSAGRLHSLSPLAVLARGYAVCWNAERMQAIRDAAVTSPGDHVHVTLSRGELDCVVRKATTEGTE